MSGKTLAVMVDTATKRGTVAFKEAHEAAHAAGVAAVEAATPTPMVVVDGTRRYFVAGGVCGFAFVKVTDRRTAFAKWAVANGHFKKAHPTGIYRTNPGFTQSMALNEAYCAAYARVIRERLGVDALMESWID